MIGTENVSNLVRGSRSRRLTGLVYTGPDDPAGATGLLFAKKLHAAYPHYDAGFGGVFDEDYYVAMQATLQAFVAANGDLSHGERRLLTALAHVRLMTPKVRSGSMPTTRRSHRTSSCR